MHICIWKFPFVLKAETRAQNPSSMKECKHWLHFYKRMSSFSSRVNFQNRSATSKLLLETRCQILDR